MIQINENLALDNFEDGQTRPDKKEGYSYFPICDLPKMNLENGANYTVSFNLTQSSKGCGEFNAGPLSKPSVEKSGRVLMDFTRYKVRKRSYFSFKYNKDTQSSIAVYTDLVSRMAGVGGTIKNVKIEKGDQMTPYLPHKSNVKAENQAIFPIGGGIKTSTLYSPRLGVRVC